MTFFGFILALFSASFSVTLPAAEPNVPEGAKRFAPVLVEQQRETWAAAPQPWTIAGLIEQESCITLKHSRCWNPRAELKTSREYGFGFGQITTAYRADGSVRFNKFAELTAQYDSLRDWVWADRYDPAYQLTAVVEMTRTLYQKVVGANSIESHWAFTLSAYNGGWSGVTKDRRLCDNTPGCDPGAWFGNVEETSLKSKQPQRAYGGRSWFEINRSHVRNVLMIRRDKYRPYWEA